MKKYSLAVTTSALLTSVVLSTNQASAQTISIEKGWNLIGLSEKSMLSDGKWKISNFIDNFPQIEQITNITRTYTVGKNRQSLKDLEVGKGYWLKSKEAFNLTFKGLPSSDTASFQAGWSLTALNAESISDLIKKGKDKGYKVNIITNITRTYTVGKSRQSLKDLEAGKGYWIYSEKLGKTVETKDGYSIELYVNSESNTIDQSLVDSIKSTKLSDLAGSNLDFKKVSNLVVSKQENGLTLVTSFLNPNADSFATQISNSLSNELSYDKVKSNQATTGTSVYVKGLKVGGSPSALNGVAIYKFDNGKKGDLIGTSDSLGYLYISAIQSNEQKVLLEKQGYDSSIQTIKALTGGANYLTINQTSNDEGKTQTISNSSNNSRILLSRNLYLSDPSIKSLSSQGFVYIPAGMKLRNSANVLIKNRRLSSFQDSVGVQNILQETGYKVTYLGKLNVSSQIDNDSLEYVSPYNHKFVDIYENGGGNSAQFYGAIKVKLQNDVLDEVADDNGDIDSSKVAEIKKSIEVHIFKDNSWVNLEQNDFELLYKDNYGSIDSEAKLFLGSNYTDSKYGLIKLNSSKYNGFYQAFATYKQPLNDTNTSFDGLPYNLNIKVTDYNGNPLTTAQVIIQEGNSEIEQFFPVNSKGEVALEKVYAEGSVENFKISVIEGYHYPKDLVLSVSDLNSPVNDKASDTNITIQLEEPPKYATIKGELANKTGELVPNAEVKLVYPLALSDVQQDVTKTIKNRDVEGIEIGAVQNAKYTWWVKAHKSLKEQQTTNSRTLKRVSRDRWIKVLSGTIKDGANFLPYNRVVSQVLAKPKNGDSQDVKIMATGQFDLAVQVEHDIDNDGKIDFVELAKDNTATLNNLDGDFATNPQNDYGKTIGFISTKIDVKKLYNDSSEADFLNTSFYVQTDDLFKGNWTKIDAETYVTDDQILNTLDEGSSISEANFIADYKKEHPDFVKLGDYSIVDIDELKEDVDYNFYSAVKVLGEKSRGYIKIKNKTFTDEQNYLGTQFDLATTLTIGTDNGYKYLKLVPNGNGGFSWKERSSMVFDPIADSDSFVKLQKSRKTKFYLDKLSSVISQNRFIEKLGMTLQNALTEAGISATADNGDKLVFDDGFSMNLIPTMHVTTTVNGVKKDVYFRQIAKIDTGDAKLKDYIILDKVFAKSAIPMDSEQTVVTDRVGLYEFPVVPIEYGTFKNSLSLLRVEATKLGYYKTPSKNIGSFEIDNSTTEEREDVERVDLTIKQKPTYNVTVNVKDEQGNPISNAQIELDGIKAGGNLKDFESTQLIESDSATFNNVIGGKGSQRILRVKVPNSDYIPKITTIRGLNTNKTIDITLIQATDVPDFSAEIFVDSSKIDYAKGFIRLDTTIFDKDDNTLTKQAEIYVYINGKSVKPVIKRTDSNSKIKFNIPLNNALGDSKLVIEVANRQGIVKSLPFYFNYNPNVGSVSGRITQFDDNDGILLLDVFDDKKRYLNSVLIDESGQYILENLKSNQVKNIVALQMNEDGKVLKKSEMIPVRVPVASTATIDFVLTDVPQDSAISGLPVFNWINTPKTTDVNKTSGLLPISATLSNFNLDSNSSEILIYVNDKPYTIAKDSNVINKGQQEHSYNVSDFTVPLEVGPNIIYGTAINPDGSFDWTSDVKVKWIPDVNSANLSTLTVTVNGCIKNNEENVTQCKPLSESYVDIYKGDFKGLLDSVTTNGQGQAEFLNLKNGRYTIGADVEGFDFKSKLVTLTNNSTFELNLSQPSQTIEISDFEIDEIKILDNQNNEIFDMQKNKAYSFSTELFVSDGDLSGFTYQWSIIDEDGKELATSSQSKFSFTPTKNGDITVQLTVTKGNSSQSYEIYSYVNEKVFVDKVDFYQKQDSDSTKTDEDEDENKDENENGDNDKILVKPPKIPSLDNESESSNSSNRTLVRPPVVPTF